MQQVSPTKVQKLGVVQAIENLSLVQTTRVTNQKQIGTEVWITPRKSAGQNRYTTTLGNVVNGEINSIPIIENGLYLKLEYTCPKRA